MHVAFWSPAWPLAKHHNGIVTYVHWTKLELERLGHQVSVFTGVWDGDLDNPNVYRVKRSFAQAAWSRLTARFARPHRDIFEWGEVIGASILKIHRRRPIDIVEMEETFGWSFGVRRVTNLPVLVKLHGPSFLSMIEEELATPFGAACVKVEGEALAKCAAIASPCNTTLHQTLERYALTPALATRVVNPINMSSATPLWSLDKCERDTILFVGRFDKRKGGDLVVQAYARLLQRRPALKLIFVGPDNGLQQSDGTREFFDSFVKSIVPQSRLAQVEFKGRLPQEEISRLRTRAMVTLVASRWENQSYTSLEAMLQGCPVVSSDVGGCPEIISHGHTGLLAASGNASDLADKIAEVLGNPAHAASMGKAARDYVLEHHSPSRVAAQSLDIYEKVLAVGKSRIDR